MEELRLLRRVRSKAAALLRAMNGDWLANGTDKVRELEEAIRQSRKTQNGDEFGRIVEDIDRVASRLPLNQALAFFDELGEIVASMRKDAPVNDSSADDPPVGPATFSDALGERWADLSPEEAQAAYDAAPEVPLSQERIDEIVAYATQPRCVCGHTCDQHANIGGSGACRVRPCPCEQWHDTPAPERCECTGCWRESNMPPVGSVDVL